MWPLTSAAGRSIPAVAMQWFSNGNGNIINYTRKNPTVNKLNIVKQVARAIAYIHAVTLVHGNITPMNVLITDDGRACLSDTGLNIRLRRAIYRDEWPVPTSWMFKAPEELKAQDNLSSFEPTTAMDVYAFASTVYSIFTSKSPFHLQPYGRGIKEIMSRGHNLERPAEVAGPVWNLLERCWSFFPEDRPSMATVEAALAIM